MLQILLHASLRAGFLTLMLLILAASFCVPCFGQDGNNGEIHLRLTCQQVARMGSSKLMNAYTRKFGDEPPAMEAAMKHYNDCKEADNIARTKRLAAPARVQVESLNSMVDGLISVRYHLDGMGVGGDAKAFALDELAVRSELSDVMSRIIAGFEEPAPARLGNSHLAPFDQRFAAVKRQLAESYGKSPGDYIEELRRSEPELYEQQKNSYFGHYEEMLTHLAKLRSAVKSLPPASAPQLIQFIENFYKAPSALNHRRSGSLDYTRHIERPSPTC